MNKKEELNNYLKYMFEFYEKHNFKFFMEKCLNYNIKIGDYGKNIDNLSRNVFSNLLKSIPQGTIKFEYKNYINYYYLSVFSLENNKVKYNIVVDIPVFEDNYERVVLRIFNYFLENKVNFSMKFYKKLKNPFFKVILEDLGQLKAFVNFFGNDEELSKEIKSRVLPFINSINLLGIYSEIYPYSFKNFFIKELYLYYDYCFVKNNIENISFDNFHSYIRNKFKLESNINRKRMFNILFTYLDIILNESDLYLLFNENSIMNLSSYEPNDFILKMDNNKMIYFINKNDNIEIKYGSIDFLNIAYSKYYSNVIRKEENDKYFNDFYSIYSDILCSNYKNINNILTLINPKMDIINRLLVIFSSAYFAFKKFDFPIKLIYKMLDDIVPKIYSYDCNTISITSNQYVLVDEYANMIIDLKDGTKTTIKEYFYNNDILNKIKYDSKVTLRTGEVLKGYEFLNDIYKYISTYDNFSDLCDNLIQSIEL